MKKLVAVKSGVTVPPKVVVKKELPGNVTWRDKLKAYYHTIFTAVGTILVMLNQIAAVAGWIPGYGTQAAGYVSVAIGVVTVISNALKSNEQWVDSL